MKYLNALQPTHALEDSTNLAAKVTMVVFVIGAKVVTHTVVVILAKSV